MECMSNDPGARPFSRLLGAGRRGVSAEPEQPAPKAWTAWYRFARDELGYEHEERVEYANLRFVEDQNRETLRRRERPLREH
jgi:hypothetical protein